MSSIGAISFGSTVDMLKNAMEGASDAHGAIASNVVNGQTPNYHRVDVNFKEALAQAAGESGNTDDLQIDATNPAHFGFNNTTPFEVSQTVDSTSKMRADGNNVDLDQEMAKLSMNADYGAMSSQFLRNQYAMYRQIAME